MKHPIILHSESKLAQLIVQGRHVALAHDRPDRTLHDIRAQYHILKIRVIVKSVIKACAKYKLLREKPNVPIMAPVPSHRLRPFARPFSTTGIDYFGPMTIIMLRRSLKRWGVMFTCMTTRAVHIEMAETLTTDSFLLAFWRFVNVRGCPGVVYSDNGTNLVAGEKEIAEGLANFHQSTIGSKLARGGIEWHFSPPIAPHFGGAWERLILMNGRPLEYVPVDPKDQIPLTPNHFLLLDASPNEPPDLFHVDEKLSNKGWRTAQVFITHFWNRWLREIVPKLNSRSKWTQPNRNLRVNDIVLVINPEQRRGEWPLGRFVEVFPGPDGVVRSASVILWADSETKTKVWTRAAHRLIVLQSKIPDVSDVRNRAGSVADGEIS